MMRLMTWNRNCARVGRLMLGVSSAALVGVPATAWAQQAPLPQSTDTVKADQEPPLEPAAQAETRADTEIVVTAQRRAERLEEVPISITSVDGERLEASAVNTVQALPQLVPGMRIDTSGAFTQPTIRGVGSALAGPGLTSNVPTYVDGFYIPNPLATDIKLISVKSVDVLKGPQGTLFGRNATGGAILVTTRDPSFEPTVNARVSYGSFDRLNLAAYASAGLTDTLAMDVTGYYERGDGFLRNIVTGEKAAKFNRWGLRSKLLFQPSEDVRFILAYSHQFEDDPTPYAASSFDGISAGNVFPGVQVADERREFSGTQPYGHRFKADVVTLTSEFDVGFADLKSYTGYRHERARDQTDYDLSPADIFAAEFFPEDHTFSQEFNLTSKSDGRLDWVIGLYYFYNNEEYPRFNASIGGGPPFSLFSSVNKTNSYAIFADATYQVTDQLFLTAGGRYSIDKLNLAFDATPQGLGADSGDATFKNFSPRLVARYELAPRTSVYASWTRGYKSGLLPGASFSTVPVDPEKIDAFELGFKTAHRGLRFDTSAFYYKYKDLQVVSFIPPQSIIRNAAKATIYGADAQVTAQITDDFNISAGVAYVHSKYDSFPDAIRYEQITDPTVPGFPLIGTFPVSATGNVLQRTPRFTGSVGAEYGLDALGGRLVFNGDVYHTSKFFFDAVEQFGQDSYTLVNARATWTAPSNRYSIAVYGTNLTDANYISQVLPDTFAIRQLFGEPRAFGVALTFKY